MLCAPASTVECSHWTLLACPCRLLCLRSALSCNTSLWCFINLTVAGTQGWLGVHFLFQWKELPPPKTPISTLLQLFHCLRSSKLSIFDVFEGECDDLVLSRDCGEGERGQNWINSAAPTLAGIPFQRGRPLVVISHCTGFIVGMLLIVLAVVCMLF